MIALIGTSVAYSRTIFTPVSGWTTLTVPLVFDSFAFFIGGIRFLTSRAAKFVAELRAHVRPSSAGAKNVPAAPKHITFVGWNANHAKECIPGLDRLNRLRGANRAHYSSARSRDQNQSQHKLRNVTCLALV